MLLVVDNYDSFTYNLVQYLGEIGAETVVRRNDTFSISEVATWSPKGILLGPGPGRPEDAGVTMELLEHFAGKLPLFGVCLGHQAIAQHFGGDVIRAKRLMHGRTSPMLHDDTGVFEGLPNPFEATRYHSLIADRASLPGCLRISAWTEEQEIMGLRHKELDIEGVQFHPESFLTQVGHRLLKNWTDRCGETSAANNPR